MNVTDKSAQLRTQGMLQLAAGNYRRALTILFDAREVEGNARPFEQALTASCIGQVLCAMGKQSDARRHFRHAVKPLYGNAPHELRNLIWRLKVEPLPIRLILAIRGLRLAYKERSRRQFALVFGLGYSRWITLHIVE